MAPADPIQIRLPASMRLQPILRAAITYAAVGAGLSPSAGSRLSSEVGTLVRRLARKTGATTPPLLRVSIERRGSFLRVAIDPGRGRKQVLLRASVRPRAGSSVKEKRAR